MAEGLGGERRPWPVPSEPWVMAQTWHDLLFAHWSLPAEAIRPLVPAPLPLDTYEGRAWIGIVPFWMSGVRPRLAPPLPPFPELNVRTYVTLGGKPGVYFFSLDAANRLAVRTARLLHLPYYDARMTAQRHDGEILYRSRRIEDRGGGAMLRARYCPAGPPEEAEPGSLADWLTARYCLYTVNRSGRVARLEIDHRPWPLQPATAEITLNRMTTPLGLALPNEPPLLHFARRLQVRAWRPRRA